MLPVTAIKTFIKKQSITYGNITVAASKEWSKQAFSGEACDHTCTHSHTCKSV